MKRIASLSLLLCALALPLCADDFAEMLHVLAVKAAALGTYDAAQVNADFRIGNYYSPQTWNERFAAEYGSIAGERTFLGVCADYTLYSYNEIRGNARKYNNAGMIGDEFYIASVDTAPRPIELRKLTTREGATTYTNGVYLTSYYNGVPAKSYESKNIWAHDEWDNKRAANHAWIWMQRDDGVWFWVDPTWTDNLGWVVWGYVSNGEEVLLKPDAKFCVRWDSRYLDSRADPPPRGPAIRQEPQPTTRVAQAREPSYSPSPYSSGYSSAVSIGLSKPLADFMGGRIVGSSFWDTFSGLSLSLETGNDKPLFFLLQIDYYSLASKSLLVDAGIGWQFGRRFGVYGGAGIGAGVEASSLCDFLWDFDLDGIHLAWKAFAGIRLSIARISLRADVSYVRDSGLILGAYVGWLF